MTKERNGETVQATLANALERGARDADPKEVADADRRLDDLLEKVADPPVSVRSEAEAAPSPDKGPGLAGVAMRTATPVAVHGRAVELRVRGMSELVEGELAPGVAAELVAVAAKNGDSVVLECAPNMPPLVVGVLQTRIPDELVIKARTIHLDAEREVLLRSGRAAMRLRQDGDVEIVGTRIAAMSRGLFRLVGRVLRLN
jgi:hypothetical protein